MRRGGRMAGMRAGVLVGSKSRITASSCASVALVRRQSALAVAWVGAALAVATFPLLAVNEL